MLKQNIYILIIIGMLVFTSCEEVIDVDLNSSDPQLVIEGNISDQSDDCVVKLSKSVNFDEPNVFPAVEGALVVISDDAGNSEILTETSPGYYTTLAIQGTPGRTYTLEVTVDGRTYTAVSYMPLSVDIESLSIEETVISEEKYVQAHYHDPEGIDNFYRFVEVLNGEELPEIILDFDELQDGDKMKTRIDSDDLEDGLSSGDEVTVFMQNVDEKVYEYFRTLDEISDGSSETAPANPLTNIEGGALGYFSAYSVVSKSIAVP